MKSTISNQTSYTIPLSEPLICGNEWRYIKKCLDTGWVSSAGEFVERFEKDVSKFVGAKYAVACVNGTAALQVALRLVGVGANTEVIVPTLTFIAPVNALRYLGAEPVFMDCDDYMNLDTEKLSQFCKDECKMTKQGLRNKKSGRIIKAVIVVHVFGNPADMSAIMQVARHYHLKVVEDAAESLGAYYTAGPYKNKFTGTIGDMGVYSFNGNKIITTGGGGMIVTDNKILAEKAKYLINQAKDDSLRYIHHEIGYNFRLTNLQAAMGVAQMERLPQLLSLKRKNYLIYKKYLADISGIELARPTPGASPNFWLYALIIDKEKFGIDKESLMCRLAKNGIQSRPVWYLNHCQIPYRNNQAYKIEKAFWFWERVLTIPSSANLTEEQIKKVVAVILRGSSKSYVVSRK